MQRNHAIEHTFGGMQEDDWSVRNPRAASWAEQVERTPDGLWRTVPGVVQVYDSPGSGGIIGLTWFEPRPNQRWLVVEEIDTETTSLLRYIDWRTGAPVTFATRSRVPGRPAAGQFLQVGRWLYHLNGLDRPIRWDGERVVPVGWYGQVPAPQVISEGGAFSDGDFADAAGATLTAISIKFAYNWQRGLGEMPDLSDTARWTVAYAVSWVNELGQESHTSPLVYASGVNDNASGVFGLRTVRLRIPPGPVEAVGCRLWRSPNLWTSQATAGQLQHVASFSVPGGFDFIDHTPDGELGEARVENAYGPVPPGTRCAAWHHDSLWVAVDDYVYRSAPTSHEVFPAGQRYTIGGAGSGTIVALVSIPRGLVVLKTTGVFILKGNPVDGYRSEVVSARAECPGPRAFAHVDGVGLFIATTTGPMVLQGTLDDDQSTALTPLAGCRKTWQRITSPGALFNAVVVHRPEVEEVWFHVPRLGETRPSWGFVYHYGGTEQRGWSMRPDWRFTSATTYRGRTWLGSSDTSDTATRGVFLLTRGGVLLTTGTANEPPDPNTPISGSYTEPYPIPESGNAYVFVNISGEALVGVYESGVVSTPKRQAVHAIELLGHPTGGEFDVQVRTSASTRWKQTNDAEWRPDIHGDQTDVASSDDFRPRYRESEWDDDGVWTTSEPSAVLVPAPRDAVHEFQIRVRGLNLRLGGLRLWADPEAPGRMREVT